MPGAKVADAQLIEAAIVETYDHIIGKDNASQCLHNLLQCSVAQLSSRFALSAETEYILPRFRGDRPGRLDVVWKDGAVPVVAFEIDSACRVKSLKELLAINANLRFWIYCGLGDITTFVNSIDPIGMIRVVRLAANLQIQEHPKSLPYKLTGSVEEVKCHNHGGHSASFEEIRRFYPRAYERWTAQEDNSLIMQFRGGKGIEELALYFQRKPGAIRSRLEKLGLLH